MHQKEELVGAMLLRSNRTNGSSFMLMRRACFKVEEFRLEKPLYFWYLFVTFRFWIEADLHPISIYIIFHWANIYHFLSSLSAAGVSSISMVES